MYGVWWSGAEPDVLPAEAGATGYNAAALQHSSGQTAVHGDILKNVYDRNKGAGKKEEVGTVLYNRGMINAMVTIEAIRTAQAKYGKKPLTGEQVRWGIENLNLDQARLRQLGFGGLMQPLKLSCNDHEGVRMARIHQWDGTKWVLRVRLDRGQQQAPAPDGRGRREEVREREEHHAARLLEGDLSDVTVP